MATVITPQQPLIGQTAPIQLPQPKQIDPNDLIAQIQALVAQQAQPISPTTANAPMTGGDLLSNIMSAAQNVMGKTAKSGQNKTPTDAKNNQTASPPTQTVQKSNLMNNIIEFAKTVARFTGS